MYAEQANSDPSVAEFLPNFESRVRDALKLILGEAGEKRISLGLAKDGSGIGGRSVFCPADVELSSSSRIDCTASEKGDGAAQRRDCEDPSMSDGQGTHVGQ